MDGRRRGRAGDDVTVAAMVGRIRRPWRHSAIVGLDSVLALRRLPIDDLGAVDF
jgi:hypothetical protein